MEWFKFRMSWRKPLMKMTDVEAGKLIKALLNYVYSEEEQEVGFREDILLSEMTDVLQEDICQFKEKVRKKEALTEKRRAAGRKGARARWAGKRGTVQQLPSDGSNCRQVSQVAGSCHKVPSDAIACHDVPCKNKNTEEDTEADSDAEKKGGSALPAEAAELPVITIPLINGDDYPVFRKDIDEYIRLYPDADIEQELRNMRGWCLGNPSRRKTRRGVTSFIISWLNTAQKEARSKQQVPENPFLAYARGEKTSSGVVLF